LPCRVRRHGSALGEVVLKSRKASFREKVSLACPSTVIAAFRAPALRCACIAPEPKTDVSGGAGIE
jgi:hypothetical protein